MHEPVIAHDPGHRGIPRLEFPAGAPSRSTLKLAKAIFAFIPRGRRRRLRAGMTGVDLGASPGGWTYQLAERGIHVIAVDSGAMAQSLLSTSLGRREMEPLFLHDS